MTELNVKFNKQTVELLVLSTVLDPIYHQYKEFNIDTICSLAWNFYYHDFIEHKRLHMNLQY